MSIHFDRENYTPPPRGFELPPEGPAEVSIIECGERQSNSGNPMLEIKCVVEDGQKGAGAHLWHYIVLNNQYSISNIGAVLESCGELPEGTADLEPMDFIGLRGKVEVKHEEYQGQTKAKIAWWIPADESTPSPDVSPDGVVDEDEGDGIPF